MGNEILGKSVMEQEIKAQMAIRTQPDSLEITSGTPSKGLQVSLKCYGDFSEITSDIKEGTEDTISSKKIKGLLKIRQYLIGKQIIQ